MKTVNLLIWLTQLGLSVAVPPACFIFLATWLHRSHGWGQWVIWVGILLGLVSAIEGLRSSIKVMAKMSEDKEKKEKPPLSFNDHS